MLPVEQFDQLPGSIQRICDVLLKTLEGCRTGTKETNSIDLFHDQGCFKNGNSLVVSRGIKFFDVEVIQVGLRHNVSLEDRTQDKG